ncbi:MAG TPA: hypothetical protein VFE22_00635, partial [Edaphobacter sp.]|nr:hypothetical protein [Edaphobacter sp.]
VQQPIEQNVSAFNVRFGIGSPTSGRRHTAILTGVRLSTIRRFARGTKTHSPVPPQKPLALPFQKPHKAHPVTPVDIILNRSTPLQN